jgi:hypothetical protein
MNVHDWNHIEQFHESIVTTLTGCFNHIKYEEKEAKLFKKMNSRSMMKTVRSIYFLFDVHYYSVQIIEWQKFNTL